MRPLVLLLMGVVASTFLSGAVYRWEDRDLVEVLRQLSQELDVNLYVGPEVAGRVTGTWDSDDPQDVLRQVLMGTPFTFVRSGRHIVVGIPECRLQLLGGLPETGTLREFQIPDTPHEDVLEALRTRFLDVQFSLNPVVRGSLFARGPSARLEEVQRWLEGQVPAR